MVLTFSAFFVDVKTASQGFSRNVLKSVTGIRCLQPVATRRQIIAFLLRRTHVGGIESQQLTVGVRVTLTRVSAVTTPIHSQLYTLWLEQEYPSEVDEGVTIATAGSTDSRFSAANIASSGKGLRHALDRLQLRAANGTKIGTR